jgi:nucleoside-diphosphate-sugar epimerase
LDDAESEYVRANVDGTRNVLEAAVKAGVPRLVFVSSVKAGGEGSDVCLDEAMEDRPETPYGRTKLEAERLVFKIAREHQMHAVVLRLPLVYGPGHKGNLERMLHAVAARRFPPLPEYGNNRSMVHVSDVADAAILAAGDPDANVQTYIVTDGRPYSTRELYALMRVALGRRKPLISLPRGALRAAARLGDIVGRLRGRRFFFDSGALEKLTESAWYSSRKIETELGFKPAYDLEKALPELIAVLRNESPGNRRSVPSS